MASRNLKWYGTDEKLYKLMEENPGELIDENEWNVVSKQDMEKYTATTFIDKARFYLSKSPPEIVQSAEKIWFAAVYAVKELYLSCGGIDLKSHKSLSYFCDFAIDNSGLSNSHRRYLRRDCWDKAQRMHEDVYGSGNFHSGEYAQIISDVEDFVFKLANFDRRKLWTEFEKTYISEADPDVKVEKTTGNIKLGGHIFKRDYSVFV